MTYVAVAAATLVSLILIRVLFNKWQNCATKPRVVRHSGCEDPPRYNHKDAHGQDLFELSMKAFREQRFLTFTEELFEKYGTTFSTISHGKIWIRSKDPEVSKAIYSTFFEKFGLEPIRYEPEGFFGDGILVVDGAKWKHSRGLIRPAFEVAHVANFDRLYRHVGRFLDILPKDGSTVDLLPILKRLVSASTNIMTLAQSHQAM
jgi:cytochrome P450